MLGRQADFSSLVFLLENFFRPLVPLSLVAVRPLQGHLYTVPVREQGNIYKPNNKAMAEEMNERQVYDAHTKEIDLVNRDPKHLNDHVVKVRRDGRPGGDVSRGDAVRAGTASSGQQPGHPALPLPTQTVFWV